MEKKIIGITGISGVGKTFLCHKLSHYFKKSSYLSAGILLRNYKNTTPENLRTSSEKTILQNQIILTDLFKKKTKDIDKNKLFFDFHFFIFNEKEKVIIPYTVIKKFNFNAIICLLDDPETIQQQRLNSPRTRPLHHSRDAIIEQQKLLRHLCNDYTELHNIPTLYTSTKNIKNITTFIKKLSG